MQMQIKYISKCKQLNKSRKKVSEICRTCPRVPVQLKAYRDTYRGIPESRYTGNMAGNYQNVFDRVISLYSTRNFH